MLIGEAMAEEKTGFAPLSDRSLAAVLDDADELFHYEEGNRPQDRAHAYLEFRGLARGVADTAMQCAVRDLVRRASEVRGPAPDGRAAAAIRAARERAQEFAVDLAIMERGLG